MTQHRRDPLLLPTFGAIAVLAAVSVVAMASTVEVILLLAATLLVATAVVWAHREGVASPIPIVALGLLIYFPVRGVVLLTAGLTTDEGINRNVLEALSGNALIASVEVLGIALIFALTCEVAFRIGRKRRVPRAPARHESRDRALTGWGGGLLLVGIVGLILQIPKGLGFLQGDEISGGLAVQVVSLAAFAFGLGLILRARPDEKLPRTVWLLLAFVAVVSFYMGSKDTMVQGLLALLFAGATLRHKTGWKPTAVVVGLVTVLVFLFFPAVQSYRREIMEGQSVTQALTGVPGELVGRTAVMGLPRTGGVPGYLGDSLLYMTNRLSGFDMMVLTRQAASDPQVLTVQTLALSPLSLVIPSNYWSSSADQVGHYFGQRYWGSAPSNNVSIAITIFGEAQLAFGPLAVIPATIVLGILASLAAAQFKTASKAGRAVGYVLMVAAIGFEHDVLYLLITTERRLALLGIVVMLAAVGSRRLAPQPWSVAERSSGQLANVGVRQWP